MAISAAMALSGLGSKQFTGELQSIYNQGAVLVRTPSSHSLASSGTVSSYHSLESGISSMSTESGSVNDNFSEKYWEFLFQLDDIQLDPGVSSTKKTEYDCQLESKCFEKIQHEGRDILNLTANIQGPWNFQYAILPTGPTGFLDNRSQYSRVNDVQIPDHNMVQCHDKNCDFKEPHFL